jgi:putative transposase
MERKKLVEKHKPKDAPLGWFLGVIGLSSKSWYAKPAAVGADETLIQEIVVILTEFPYYGYRRVAKELRRRGNGDNQKRVQRIMRKHGLTQKRRKQKVWTTNSNHGLAVYPNLIKNIVASFPNHVWVTDFTYIHLRNGFCYLATVLDVFTRQIRGWSLKRNMETELVVLALDRALQKGMPQYHHSDRGSQYCSATYVGILQEKGIKISMSEKGEPTQNGYAESFFRTLKVEEVYLMDYDTVDDALASVTKFIDVVYAKKRLHSSIGYLPPEEFEADWIKNNPTGTQKVEPLAA